MNENNITAAKERKSSIELMRIVCILLIIAHHYYGHGGWSGGLSVFNRRFLEIAGGLPRLAINCFVLVTGYYGANLKTKRVVAIVRDRWFYSVFITLVLLGTGFCDLSVHLIFQTLFPLLSCRHNYITTFVMLYFLAPFINEALENLSKRRYENLLLISTFFFSIVPSVYPSFSGNTYSYVVWMIYIFVVGRYLSQYAPQLPWKSLFLVLILIWITGTYFVEPRLPFLYNTNIFSMSTQNSFLNLLASVCFFEIFGNARVKQNKMINSLASSTFAVYIIHDDPYVRNVIWSQIFHNSEYGQSGLLWLHFIITILIIYFGCIFIDKLYRATIGKLLKQIPTGRLEQMIDRLTAKQVKQIETLQN
ncbi:MAG: acyltransferase [Clostridiales bacterium]|nr:acyltransferase [Clostridiales bacterium]MCC8107026.1 acyltransferase [Clostridiales bacterium]